MVLSIGLEDGGRDRRSNCLESHRQRDELLSQSASLSQDLVLT